MAVLEKFKCGKKRELNRHVLSSSDVNGFGIKLQEEEAVSTKNYQVPKLRGTRKLN